MFVKISSFLRSSADAASIFVDQNRKSYLPFTKDYEIKSQMVIAIFSASLVRNASDPNFHTSFDAGDIASFLRHTRHKEVCGCISIRHKAVQPSWNIFVYFLPNRAIDMQVL